VFLHLQLLGYNQNSGSSILDNAIYYLPPVDNFTFLISHRVLQVVLVPEENTDGSVTISPRPLNYLAVYRKLFLIVAMTLIYLTKMVSFVLRTVRVLDFEQLLVSFQDQPTRQ
jgi:hypothetical protein